ncbi:hypothetical protein Ae201684P_010506 [Aphanomyces euteiches]|nr:hypothetical protein Ae201684P_010506 [Aphanomyces euteiches]
MELRTQYTVMGNTRAVADVIWNPNVRSSPQHAVQAIDMVHDHLLYISMDYGPLKYKFLQLAAMFELDGRIVITNSTIAFDERFPMVDGESRVHGYAWTVLDPLEDGRTLCRKSIWQYTPVNKHGPLTLEEIGILVQDELRSQEPRENIITKFQDVIEDGNIMQREQFHQLADSRRHTLTKSSSMQVSTSVGSTLRTPTVKTHGR